LSILNPKGSTTVSFNYDGNGERVKKVSSTQTVYYFGEFYENRGGIGVYHLFAGNRRIASIRTDGKHQHFHSNHLGSASVITDDYGNRKERMEYLPFGTYLESVDYDGAFPDVFHTFTGQEEDDELGFLNYGARLYDPLLGRFISPDRIVQAPENIQSLNRYSYCLNNPLIYTDPSGEFIEWIIIGFLMGAMMGAAQADMAGTSILKGAAIGGLIGAASGAAGGWVGGVVTDMLPFVGSSANIIAAMSGGFTAGVISGGANAAVNGENPWKGALYGGLVGAAIAGAVQGAIELANGGTIDIRCPRNYLKSQGVQYRSDFHDFDLNPFRDIKHENMWARGCSADELKQIRDEIPKAKECIARALRRTPADIKPASTFADQANYRCMSDTIYEGLEVSAPCDLYDPNFPKNSYIGRDNFIPYGRCTLKATIAEEAIHSVGDKYNDPVAGRLLRHCR
jgi:RHS repeat-associated protein